MLESEVTQDYHLVLGKFSNDGPITVDWLSVGLLKPLSQRRIYHLEAELAGKPGGKGFFVEGGSGGFQGLICKPVHPPKVYCL